MTFNSWLCTLFYCGNNTDDDCDNPLNVTLLKNVHKMYKIANLSGGLVYI